MRHFYVCIAPALGCCWGGGNGRSRNKETRVVPLDDGIDSLQGMMAPKLDKLRLENTYDKQSSSYDGLDDEHVTPPHYIHKKVEDSEASAANTGSISCSESCDRTETRFGNLNSGKAWSLCSVNIA